MLTLLEQRLMPVLIPTGPSGEGNAPPKPNQSPVVLSLRDHGTGLDAALNRISDILNRLEL